MVKIRHKREFDAEMAGHASSSPHYYDSDGSTDTHSAESPGNIIYYGYGDPSNPAQAVQFTTTGATEHKPVEIITVFSEAGGSKHQLEIDAVHNPGPKIKAVLYSKRYIFGIGEDLEITVHGNDDCGQSTGKAPTATVNPYRTFFFGGDVETDGNPANPIRDNESIDIAGYIENIKKYATVTIAQDQTGKSFGKSNSYAICYSDTSAPVNIGGLKLTDVTGYGFLAVDGDLWLSGKSKWDGIILVTGVLNITGYKPGIKINGAILAGSSVILDGKIDLTYNSCINKELLFAVGLDILNWKEKL
jgi:hypothetical protein